MAAVTALIDANVLVSMTLTDLIIECAYQGLFAVRWSDDIHDEWVRAALKISPKLSPAKLTARRQAMDRSGRDALVLGYQPLIGGLSLPDVDDRHVLAAAIHGGGNTIVTFNLADFPSDVLAAHAISAVHPDMFLLNAFAEQQPAFLACVKACRSRLARPAMDAETYLARLARVGAPLVASRLAAYKSLI